jgi:RNA polymerase-binding transcription factor DksA
MENEAARHRLEEMMKSIGERRARLDRHVGHRDEALAADFEEQAVELENSETMFALDDQLQQEAREIQAALGRLERGTYGECEKCGATVDPRRLEVLPATRFCIGCASGAKNAT